MEHHSEDVDKYRMKHESDKEWQMRRTFLLAHREKFSETRLICLASCYINVECYNCRYPPGVMRELEDLMAELPNRGRNSSVKPGSSIPVKFVAAEKPGTEPLSSSSVVKCVRDRVGGQMLTVDKPGDGELQHCPKPSELGARFQCLAEKLQEVCRSQTVGKNDAELIQMAVDKAQMSATTEFTELGPRKGFRCDLTVDLVRVSSSEAQNKKLAKHQTFSAAAELLRKPYLHVSEDTDLGASNFRLVGSDTPFARRNLVPVKSSSKASISKGPSLPAGRSCAHAGTKRPLNSVSGAPLKEFVILQQCVGEPNPVSVLQNSADFNKWPLEYEMDETAMHCRCRAILGGHVLGDAAGDKKSSKSAAAQQALKQLANTCCTVSTKKLGDEELIDSLKRSEVLGGKLVETRIPESNVGSQLLKKMGWTGGGVGRGSNKGIEEPVSLVAVVNRAGLGSTQLSDFAPSVKRIVADFIRSGGHDDLVFSPEFTAEERAVIHAEARRRHLKTRSYGTGDQRHLILSLQRTPLQLVEHLRAHGGETIKYSLIEPGEPSA